MLPAVQQYVPAEGTVYLPRSLRLQAQEWADKAAACAALLMDTTVTVGEDAHIRAVRAALPAEGYRLTVEDTVTVAYADYAGLCHGLAAVAGLMTAVEGGYTLPRCTAEDAPAAAHRGVMLDVARGIQPLEELLDDMVLLARARMNVLHLHLADSVGCAVALECLPDALILEEHYTRADVAAIVERANLLGLEIIPEYDMPAHSRTLTRVYPHLRCPVEGNGGWVACAGQEELFTLYEAIIKELAVLFPHGRYLHVGGDELEFTDIPALDIFCYWDTCPHCRKRMEQEGLADMRELYYYVMTRLNDMVKATGRRMIMWSDQIDCTRPCSLPRDILLHFWRIACPGRGPSAGCSLAAQAAMGFEIINSHFLEAYIEEEGEMSEDTIRDWRWDARPFVAEEHKRQMVGGELCVWMYGPTADPKWDRHAFDFINRELPAAVMLMGNALWSGRPITFDRALYTALTRAVLGAHTPTGLDVFAAFGGAMPPKNNDVYAWHDKVTLSAAELAALEETLRRMPPHRRTVMYADWVAQVIKERDEQ